MPFLKSTLGCEQMDTVARKWKRNITGDIKQKSEELGLIGELGYLNNDVGHEGLIIQEWNITPKFVSLHLH